MKDMFGRGWVIQLLGGAILASFLALPAYSQLMLAHEGHHDAGGCDIKNGEFPITFSAYEVPEGNIPPMHSYCSNIPTPGKVQLTVELPDWDSREIPLAVRLVAAGHDGHGGHAGHGEARGNKEMDHNGHDMSDHDDHEMHDHDHQGGAEGDPGKNDIVYMPYQKHNSGIIVVSADLQKGHYEILLERKDDVGNVKISGRVPFGVGGSGGHGGHGGGFGIMEIGLLIIIVGGAAFYFMHRKNTSEEGKL